MQRSNTKSKFEQTLNYQLNTGHWGTFFTDIAFGTMESRTVSSAKKQNGPPY